MKARIALGAVLIACSACAHPVADPAQAIAIADKACGGFHVAPEKWHAQLVGDQWHVEALLSIGQRHSHSLIVQVPRNANATDKNIICTSMDVD